MIFALRLSGLTIRRRLATCPTSGNEHHHTDRRFRLANGLSYLAALGCRVPPERPSHVVKYSLD